MASEGHVHLLRHGGYGDGDRVGKVGRHLAHCDHVRRDRLVERIDHPVAQLLHIEQAHHVTDERQYAAFLGARHALEGRR